MVAKNIANTCSTNKKNSWHFWTMVGSISFVLQNSWHCQTIVEYGRIYFICPHIFKVSWLFWESWVFFENIFFISHFLVVRPPSWEDVYKNFLITTINQLIFLETLPKSLKKNQIISELFLPSLKRSCSWIWLPKLCQVKEDNKWQLFIWLL